MVDIYGVKAKYVEGSDGYCDRKYLVSSAGFSTLVLWFFKNPRKNKDPLRPKLRIGTEKYIGVLFFNNIYVDIEE
jgi:hypothetical protein